MRRYIICILFLLFAHPTNAIYDPLSVPNNKFGIHVADINDLSDAAELVNSQGGSWGYVTFVIADNDRDVGKWQNIFKDFKKLKLIPIVRLATHVVDNSWSIPQIVDANTSANFLSDLPWPTKNRYVILFNEPNHAKEWGNTVDPEGYAAVAQAYAIALKTLSDEYFILPAGFDASATNSSQTMDEEEFLRRVFQAEPELLTLIDGWTSHSYPNPAFSGSPYASGRGTLKTFEWELTLLPKELPVFITETGWAHGGSGGSRLSPDVVASYITTAASTVWSDPRIIAVTPFLFQYQEPLFSMFSWLIPVEKKPYPFYLSYQRIEKVLGNPLLPPSVEYLALLQQPLNL